MPHADEDAAARQRMRSGGRMTLPETVADLFSYLPPSPARPSDCS
jgi:hypothetical protein